ncbi:ATP-binding protein [Nonomuraea roseoviolacea]|uniref:ATPase/DNA-binding CsgD family transcriptional regulator n=1 Tax=Nonomuraea roseoviolacea subsp. carminata TaxID=160689 RepID=A0ABT1K3X8_9ACTN|nr:LuxR C-terminal-related transcriptional regulator [Nonomuraea roseoviolacea]MCP2348186.1 putative ATPase/DNA-binding CsgD family transcriptional regulator [Nonomuraea roseoviolacea subsp. carminata]
MVSKGRRLLDNLPADLTSFVDRRLELAEIKRLLSLARLVTLTGVGGVGKTRLALRAAADLRRAFADGVWMVDLAALADPELLVQTVAEHLGLSDQSARPPLVALCERIADKQLLILLDNCEHLLDACARLAHELLRASPGLRILSTSREQLGVYGEHVLAVPPLSVPTESPESVTVSAAVALFADRAASVVPGFAVTPDNAAVLGRLCQRLEGIPLAIELAAVRMRVMSPQHLLDRLDDRFQLLSGGPRTMPHRQQTLRALLDWSRDLCSPQERTLWARLSVFYGSFEMEAVEEVCSLDGLPRECILDLLIQLVDKSILIRDEGSPDRYRLLETMRQYGAEMLSCSGEATAMRRRHRDYYERLAVWAEAEWFGAQQLDCTERLWREHANLRAALDFCRTEPGEAETGLRMAAALRMYWLGSGLIREGRGWLDRLLPLHTESTPARAKALWLDTWLSLLQNDEAAALPMLKASRELAEQLDDASALAYVAQITGLAEFRGDLPATVALFEEALAQHRADGDLMGVAYALIRLATTSILLDDADRAVAYCEECVALSASHGEVWFRAHALWMMGIAVWRAGDHRRAAALEQESIRVKAAFHDQVGVAIGIEVLAWIAATEGRSERAVTLLGALETIWLPTGMSLFNFVTAYHDQCQESTREILGNKGYESAFRRGNRFTVEGAIAFALDEKPDVAAVAAKPEAESGPLTRREREIAELVAQGLSNKEIATALVIATRTAEGHVEHILAKLGFTSRVQIAAWVVEHGLHR